MCLIFVSSISGCCHFALGLSKVRRQIHRVSAFSVFLMQLSSFLAYQRRMQQGCNNVLSMFGAHEIPSDNQIRNLLDTVKQQALKPLYNTLLEDLMNKCVIEHYLTLQGKVLLALDGVTYFSSSTLH